MPANTVSYRLIYFNTRGAGELCRLTLALSGAEWQDIRYPLSVAASGFAPGEGYQRDAASGAFDANLGKLPILQVVDEHKHPDRAVANIGQSHAICRLVAMQHGLMGTGTSAVEFAQVDSLYEACRDIRTAWYKAKRAGQKPKWFESDGTGTLKEYCQQLERAVTAVTSNRSSSNSPWCLGGNDPTLADIALYHMLGTPPPSLTTGGVPSFMDGESDRVRQAYETCPRILDSLKAMAENKRIREWEANRPDTFS